MKQTVSFHKLRCISALNADQNWPFFRSGRYANTHRGSPIRAPKTSQIERTEQAVIDAVTELLREVGYQKITIDLIAQRSGVARSTIYRRWADLPALAIAAFDRALGPNLPSPDHGNVREDLVHLYRRFGKILTNSFWGQLLPSVIEAATNDSDFEAMLSRLDSERRVNSRTILQRAIKRGELSASANLDWIIDSLSGMLYYRFLISGGSTNEPGLVEWAVDCVLGNSAPTGANETDKPRVPHYAYEPSPAARPPE